MNVGIWKQRNLSCVVEKLIPNYKGALDFTGGVTGDNRSHAHGPVIHREPLCVSSWAPPSLSLTQFFLPHQALCSLYSPPASLPLFKMFNTFLFSPDSSHLFLAFTLTCQDVEFSYFSEKTLCVKGGLFCLACDLRLIFSS